MNIEKLKSMWLQEEAIAQIKGWDFSYIAHRSKEENDFPWNYKELIKQHLNDDKHLLDYDTGGGEFLLSLHHPPHLTAATEGYAPNVKLCQEKLVPLGINFKDCANPSAIPYDDGSFDMIINRHGRFDASELFRLLKKDGLFITQQVGCDNDRDLVDLVLPGTESPFPHLNLAQQRKAFEDAGFEIIRAEEVYRPIYFYDVGAFVWFARIIEWEFPNFSVEKCFEKLLQMQKMIDLHGKIEGTIHRFLIVAKK